jgi:hypothetical protein
METEFLNSETIYKLLAFTLAMVVIPIGSYFLTVHTVFKGLPPSFCHLAARTLTIYIGKAIRHMPEDWLLLWPT